MSATESAVEIDALERRLLPSLPDSTGGDGGDDEDAVLYSASFDEMEDNFVKYQTAQWVMYSVILILAWGIGLLMLLYVPIRRYNLRQDFRSRRLYLTPNAVVYKVSRPTAFPCFGVLKKEKYVILPSIADIAIEQGYLQSFFGVYSIRIENAGVQRPASDDVKILGVANPRAFRMAVLTHLSMIRRVSFNCQVSRQEDPQSAHLGSSAGLRMYSSRSQKNVQLLSSGDQILQKLEDVGSSIKRVEKMIGNRQSHTSEIQNLGDP